ncbi:kelch repeat-containing protein [Adhaeribacter aquaticus]|uniref:kelch repeat-containing protein n=1 Tax=Adhaeribacter aquaticus TaxID=299567 RepID=UPI000425A2B0|nr:kelch repeat-containing protein [Adhaeribacter aquaticus]
MKAIQYLFCLSLLMVGVLLFPGCTTDQEDGVLPNIDTLTELTVKPSKGKVNELVTVSGKHFGNRPANITVRFNGAVAEVMEMNDSTIITKVPVNGSTGKVSVTRESVTLTSTQDFIVLTGTWTRKKDFLGEARGNALTISGVNSGFLTLGGSGDFTEKDFWEYLPASDVWIQKNDFPGLKRLGGVSFTIGNKIYITTGFTYWPLGFKNDFWEYNTETGTWTKKADFPGSGRIHAAAFVLDNKGYIAVGRGEYFDPEVKDMWEYDPATDKWTQKKDIPFNTLESAISFKLGDKAYVGGGYYFAGTESIKESYAFWQYEPNKDLWTALPDFNKEKKKFSLAFVLNNTPYLMEENGNCWQYNVTANQWLEKAPYPGGTGRNTFVVNNKAYVIELNSRSLYEFNPE